MDAVMEAAGLDFGIVRHCFATRQHLTWSVHFPLQAFSEMRLISWSHLMLSDLIAMVGRLQAASFTSCVAFITVIVAIKRKDCHLSGFTFSNALHSFRTNGSIFLMSATHSL